MGDGRRTGGKAVFKDQLLNLVAELKVHLLVKAVDSLRIAPPAVTLQQNVYMTVAIPYPCLADVLDLQLQFGLLVAPGLVDTE